MPWRKPPNQTFRILTKLSDASAKSGYHHLILTLGGRDTIIQPKWSIVHLDGVQLAKRFGYRVETKDEIPVLTIYDNDILERFKIITTGKPEVDYAIAMHDVMICGDKKYMGVIDIASGTRRLKVDGLVDRLGKRIEGGSGRVAMAAISLLDEDILDEDFCEEIFGYFLSNESVLFEYRGGHKNRTYNPRTKKVTHFIYGPDGTFVNEQVFDIRDYNFRLPGE